MSTAVEKNQTEMPDMPQTDLGRYAQDWCAQKEKVAVQKEKLDGISEKILDAMHQDDKRILVIEYEGEKYRFEVVEGSEKLKVAKAAA